MSLQNGPRRRASVLLVVVWVAVLSVTAVTAVAVTAPVHQQPLGAASAPSVPSSMGSFSVPASGTLAMSPTGFANGAVPTLAVFSGGTFGSGATVAFCLSATTTFSSSVSIGSYTLSAGGTTLTNAVATVHTSQAAGPHYVAATDGSCGGGSSTYTSPVPVTIATPPYPSFSITNQTATVGASLSASGAGWDAGASISVFLNYLGSATSLGSFTTTSVGALPSSATVTVPSGLAQGTYGVFAEETHGAAGGPNVWVGFSPPYGGSTNFFSVGPSITVSPFVFSGASGSSLTITGTGFYPSATIAANSITVGGAVSSHSAVSVSAAGTFSVTVATGTALGAPGGAKSVGVATSPASSTSTFANAVWVSSPNPGALSLLFNGAASGPVTVTPTASITAEAWNFPAGATVSFWVGPTSLGAVNANSLGFAQLPSTTTLPGMPAGSYRAVAADAAAGLYSNPVTVTVNSLSVATDPAGFVLPTSGTSEYLPSGGSILLSLYGLAPGTPRSITDSVFGPLVTASLLASPSVGLAYESGFAALEVSVGTLVASSGQFLPAANGTLLVTYAPLYSEYPTYGVAVPSTGTVETVSLCAPCSTVGTYYAIGTPSIGPADWTGYLAGGAASVQVSGLIPSGSLLYSGSPTVSYYYNVYVGSTLLQGTSGSTYCLAASPSTCYATSGTLTILFTMPSATGVQELAITYSGASGAPTVASPTPSGSAPQFMNPPSAILAEVPIVVSTPGSSAGAGAILATTDPITGDTMVVGYNLLPAASSYTLNVSTSQGVHRPAASVQSSGALVAVDLTAHGYTDEPAGLYSVLLYVVATGGTHASVSTTYSVTVTATVSPASGLPGASPTLTASGLASGAYYDLYFAGQYQATVSATLAGDLTTSFTVPTLPSGTYTVSLSPTGTTSPVASTQFAVVSNVLWNPDPSAFPGQRVSFVYTLPSALSETPLAGTQGYAAVLLNGTPYAVVPASYSGATEGSTISGSFTMFNGAPGSYYTLYVVPEYSVAATAPTSVAFPFTAAATPVAESFVFSAPSGLSVVSATASLTDTTTGASSATAVIVSVTATKVTFTVAATSQVASDAYVVTGTVLLTSGASTTYVDAALASSPTTLTLVSGSGAFVLSLNQSDIAEIATRTGQVVNISIDQLSAKVSDVYSKLNATYVALTTNFGNMTVALDTIQGTLTGIGQNVVELNTTIGTFGVKLDQIGANLTGISNGVMELTTAVGDLTLSVAGINATIGSVNGNVMTVLTDLGSVQASLRSLNTTVEAMSVTTSQIASNVRSLLGATVYINTTLGTLTGTVGAISGNVAIILTDVGTLQTTVNSIQGSLSSTQTNTNTTNTYLLIILVLVIVAIAVAVVALLRGGGRSPPPPRGWRSSSTPPEAPKEP